MTTRRIEQNNGQQQLALGPLLDIAQVAERLGVQVRHVRRLVHERRIPFVKWGHLLRFDAGEIEEWVDRARRPASAFGQHDRPA